MNFMKWIELSSLLMNECGHGWIRTSALTKEFELRENVNLILGKIFVARIILIQNQIHYFVWKWKRIQKQMFIYKFKNKPRKCFELLPANNICETETIDALNDLVLKIFLETN
ncbi:hypothetical protein ACO02O_06421 [Dirofilaria immitis]